MNNVNDNDLPQVTEKYWRAESNSGIRGTGLGLWLVKKLCSLATINMQLKIRKGRFTVTLEIPCVSP